MASANEIHALGSHVLIRERAVGRRSSSATTARPRSAARAVIFRIDSKEKVVASGLLSGGILRRKATKCTAVRGQAKKKP